MTSLTSVSQAVDLHVLISAPQCKATPTEAREWRDQGVEVLHLPLLKCCRGLGVPQFNKPPSLPLPHPPPPPDSQCSQSHPALCPGALDQTLQVLFQTEDVFQQFPNIPHKWHNLRGSGNALSSSIYGNPISIWKKPFLCAWSPGGNSEALYPHLSKPPLHVPLGGSGCTSAVEAVRSDKTWVSLPALPQNSPWVATDN